MSGGTLELRDGLLVYRGSAEVCVKGVARIASVSTAVQDLDDHAAVRHVKAYVNALNLGFPLEFYTRMRPVDKLEFTRGLERVIAESMIVYEVNPLKYESRIRAARARLLRNRVIEDSVQPYEIEVYVAVSSCADDFESALEALRSRLRVLRGTLGTLGVDVEEVDAGEVIPRLVLAEMPLRRRGLLHRALERFRKRIVSVDLVSVPAFTFIPLLGRTRSSLRSSGVRLGVDPESGEEVYWNLDEATSPHVLVVGPSGIGKTTFLAELSLSLSGAGLGVLVLDPKNEYAELFGSRGWRVSRYALGRDVSPGFAELLKIVRDSLGRDVSEVLLDMLAVHRELGRRDVFECLYTALSSIGAVPDGGDLELLGSLKRFSRYCSEGYPEYVVGKALSALEAVSGGKRGLVSLLRELSGVNVVDVSAALSVDPHVLPMLLKVLSMALRTLPRGSPGGSRYRRVLVVDEAWTVLRDGSLEAVEELIRVGRSFGTVVALATQAIRDFTKALGPLVDNLGLLVVLPSTSSGYWEEVAKVLRVSGERIEKMRTLGRGYALVRISPDPRALLVRLELAPPARSARGGERGDGRGRAPG